jgi:hypothetical protein
MSVLERKNPSGRRRKLREKELRLERLGKKKFKEDTQKGGG